MINFVTVNCHGDRRACLQQKWNSHRSHGAKRLNFAHRKLNTPHRGHKSSAGRNLLAGGGAFDSPGLPRPQNSLTETETIERVSGRASGGMTILQQIAMICPLVFLAGMTDAIAGGGGLLSLPAYYLAGLPAHVCLGSNKFSSCSGMLFSAGRFLRSGNIHIRAASVAAAAALAGSFLGARLTLLLDDHALRIAMLILLPAASVFLFLRGRQETDENTFVRLSRRRAVLLSAAIGFAIGAYDGFFGPGSGTLLILAFTAVLGFDMKTACGNAKAVSLASNLAALVTFIAAGTIQYRLAVPAAACSIAGHWIGSGLAIRKGAKFIRPVMLLMLVFLFSKMVYDLLG